MTMIITTTATTTTISDGPSPPAPPTQLPTPVPTPTPPPLPPLHGHRHCHHSIARDETRVSAVFNVVNFFPRLWMQKFRMKNTSSHKPKERGRRKDNYAYRNTISCKPKGWELQFQLNWLRKAKAKACSLSFIRYTSSFMLSITTNFRYTFLLQTSIGTKKKNHLKVQSKHNLTSVKRSIRHSCLQKHKKSWYKRKRKETRQFCVRKHNQP